MTPAPILITWKLEEYGNCVFLVRVTGPRNLRSDVAVIRNAGEFVRCGHPAMTEIIEPVGFIVEYGEGICYTHEHSG